MIKYYFKIAFKNLLRNKIFTVINITGLAIGISTSLVIYLLVNYHFSFEKFQKDRDRIYRVVSDFSYSSQSSHSPGIALPVADAAQREVPGLDIVAPFYIWDEKKVSIPVPEKSMPAIFKKQKEIIFADERYFNLIKYEWLAGSSKTALTEPYQTVLTESKAKQFFPGSPPSQIIGRQLNFDDTISTIITGVVSDIRANTDFGFKIFISRISLEKTSLKPRNWEYWESTSRNSQVLFKILPSTSPQLIERSLYNLYEKYHDKEFDDPKNKTSFKLQPLKDIHFNTDYSAYEKPQAHKPVLYGLVAVALFLLLLGCINFINLTTANASQRIKEIGIRKTMGSNRKQLIAQFFTETFLLTLFATLFSLPLVPFLLKAFSDFIPAELKFPAINDPQFFLFLSILVIVVTLFSGLFPAIILSSYKPMLLLKNMTQNSSDKTVSSLLRKFLGVFQFTIAQLFVISTLLVSKQILFVTKKDQGFKKEGILSFYTNPRDTVKSNKYVLINKIKAFPEVSMVSLCILPPSSNSTWSESLNYKDGKKDLNMNVLFKCGDSNYLKLYGIKLLAGRNNESSDTMKSFVINETYAHALGFTDIQQAVGKNLNWDKKLVPIVGVVADFNQVSLHEAIKPLVISSQGRSEYNISIALFSPHANGTWEQAISKIEKAWKDIYPEEDFTYTFFEDDIAKYYEKEQNIAGLLGWASGLAIFISCLGLLGLVIYTTNRRTKEIGIRKVLGASVWQNALMISKDFISLILIAFVVAAPVAFAAIYKWLQSFSYRTSISWWIFGLSLVIMILIALITLSFLTVKVALANPVKSLRAE